MFIFFLSVSSHHTLSPAPILVLYYIISILFFLSGAAAGSGVGTWSLMFSSLPWLLLSSPAAVMEKPVLARGLSPAPPPKGCTDSIADTPPGVVDSLSMAAATKAVVVFVMSHGSGGGPTTSAFCVIPPDLRKSCCSGELAAELPALLSPWVIAARDGPTVSSGLPVLGLTFTVTLSLLTRRSSRSDNPHSAAASARV